MTREEEIKERVEVCCAYYTYDGRKIATIEAESDLRYLLARNAELKRRVERLEKVYERSRDLIFDGIYGGEYYDSLLDTVARDRSTGRNTRAVALFDALIALDAADAEEK